MALALDQSGTAQGVTFGDVTFLDGKTQATWLMWVNHDWAGSTSNANWLRKDGAWNMFQRFGSNDDSVCRVWDTSLTTSSRVAHDADTWYFMACVADMEHTTASQRLRWYRAEAADESLTLVTNRSLNEAAFVNSSNPLMVGTHDNQTGERMSGMARGLAILDAPLSPAELLAIRDDFAAALGHGANLMLACPFDYDARDVSGNDLHGSTFGDPTFTEDPPGDPVPQLDGHLAVEVDLAGSLAVPPAAVPQLAGALPVHVDLAGALHVPPATVPQLAGGLAVEVDLSGRLVPADLAPTPADRTLTVPPAGRTLAVPARGRTLAVSPAGRAVTR